MEFKHMFGAKPVRMKGYHLLWLRQAEGSIGVDYFTHRLQGDMLWLINEQRTLQLSLSKAEGLVICFTELFLPLSTSQSAPGFENVLYNYFCHSPFICLSEANGQRLQRLTDELTEEYGRADRQEELLRSYLKILLLTYQRLIKEGAENTPGSGKYERVIALRKDVEQYYKIHKDASFYAGRQALTPKRLNEIVKEALGKTVTSLLHERLLLEAQRMLHFSSYSVKEIAFELGFDDPSYFYRFFKRSSGLTPETFRSQIQSLS
jgi:AraC-like DNA-binding protein